MLPSMKQQNHFQILCLNSKSSLASNTVKETRKNAAHRFKSQFNQRNVKQIQFRGFLSLWNGMEDLLRSKFNLEVDYFRIASDKSFSNLLRFRRKYFWNWISSIIGILLPALTPNQLLRGMIIVSSIMPFAYFQKYSINHYSSCSIYSFYPTPPPPSFSFLFYISLFPSLSLFVCLPVCKSTLSCFCRNGIFYKVIRNSCLVYHPKLDNTY